MMNLMMMMSLMHKTSYLLAPFLPLCLSALA